MSLACSFNRSLGKMAWCPLRRSRVEKDVTGPRTPPTGQPRKPHVVSWKKSLKEFALIWAQLSYSPNRRGRTMSVRKLVGGASTVSRASCTRGMRLFLLVPAVPFCQLPEYPGLSTTSSRRAATPFTMPAMSPTMTEGGVASCAWGFFVLDSSF